MCFAALAARSCNAKSITAKKHELSRSKKLTDLRINCQMRGAKIWPQNWGHVLRTQFKQQIAVPKGATAISIGGHVYENNSGVNMGALRQGEKTNRSRIYQKMRAVIAISSARHTFLFRTEFWESLFVKPRTISVTIARASARPTSQALKYFAARFALAVRHAEYGFRNCNQTQHVRFHDLRCACIRLKANCNHAHHLRQTGF